MRETVCPGRVMPYYNENIMASTPRLSSMHDAVLQEEDIREGPSLNLNDLEKGGNNSSDLNPPSRQNESNTSSQGLKQLETVQVCSMRRNQLKDLRYSYLVG